MFVFRCGLLSVSFGLFLLSPFLFCPVLFVFCIFFCCISFAVRLHDSISEEGFHYLVFDLWVTPPTHILCLFYMLCPVLPFCQHLYFPRSRMSIALVLSSFQQLRISQTVKLGLLLECMHQVSEIPFTSNQKKNTIRVQMHELQHSGLHVHWYDMTCARCEP